MDNRKEELALLIPVRWISSILETSSSITEKLCGVPLVSFWILRSTLSHREFIESWYDPRLTSCVLPIDGDVAGGRSKQSERRLSCHTSAFLLDVSNHLAGQWKLRRCTKASPEKWNPRFGLYVGQGFVPFSLLCLKESMRLRASYRFVKHSRVPTMSECTTMRVELRNLLAWDIERNSELSTIVSTEEINFGGF